MKPAAELINTSLSRVFFCHLKKNGLNLELLKVVKKPAVRVTTIIFTGNLSADYFLDSFDYSFGPQNVKNKSDNKIFSSL